MGCWDILCPFCGLPPRTFARFESLEEILQNLSKEQLDFYDKNKKLITSIMKNMKWLKNSTLLMPDGNIYHDLEETSCNGKFNTPGSIIGTYAYPRQLFMGDILETPFGIFLHTDCYKYISKKLKFNFTIKHIRYKDIYDDGLFNGIKYLTAKYSGQDFNLSALLTENPEYLLSPLKSKSLNKKQIDLVCSKIKLTTSHIKEKDNRPSPTYSASNVPDKSYGLGNDNNIWIKQDGRWNKLNTTYVGILFNIKHKNLKLYPFLKYDIIEPKYKVRDCKIISPMFITEKIFNNTQILLKIATTDPNKIFNYLKSKKIKFDYKIIT